MSTDHSTEEDLTLIMIRSGMNGLGKEALAMYLVETIVAVLMSRYGEIILKDARNLSGMMSDHEMIIMISIAGIIIISIVG